MYKELKKLYYGTRQDFFVMAISHLLDIGYRNAIKITEDDIAKMKGNGLMTQGFVQELVRTTVEIAKTIDNVAELFQFCQAEDVFDTRFYANKLSRDRLETMLHNAIAGLIHGDYDGESLADYLGADEVEMEMLGYEGEV